MVIHVRRQVKKLGREFVFALPKNDTERTVPMSEGTALVLKEHIEAVGPRPYTLPWEKVDGDPHTVKLLFRWTDDKHIRARNYDELVWKPALFHTGVIREPTKDARGRKQYVTRRENGMHALRHYYASITLADGVNIKELAEYLGHGDPGFTLRGYTHMLPSSHERARKTVDNRLACNLLFGISRNSNEAGRHTLPKYLVAAGQWPVYRRAWNQSLTCQNISKCAKLSGRNGRIDHHALLLLPCAVDSSVLEPDLTNGRQHRIAF